MGRKISRPRIREAHPTTDSGQGASPGPRRVTGRRPRPAPAPRARGGAPEYLTVGVLIGAHGIRGEVKLLPQTEFPDRLAEREWLFLRDPSRPDQPIREVQVQGSRQNKGLLLVRLEGVDDMEQADAMRGLEVVIPLRDAAPLPEGRYYEHEILGCRVVTPTGEELGVVTEIMASGESDVYVAGPWLIPATHDAITCLAPEEKLIVVRSREYLEGEEVR